jgi:hypothetical protein
MQLAQTGGSSEQVALGLDEVIGSLFRLRGGALGIGLAAQSGLGVIGRDPGQLAGFGAGLGRDRAAPFGMQQVQVAVGHPQEHLVPRGLAGELALPHDLPACQALKNHRGYIAAPDEAGNINGARAHGAGTEAKVQRVPVDLENRAVGLL